MSGEKRESKKRLRKMISDEKAQMSFALVAIVMILMSVFIAAYFARLDFQQRDNTLKDLAIKQMYEEVYNIEQELESAVEEAGHRAIEIVEEDMLKTNGAGIGRQVDVIYAVQENTTRLFEEYYNEHYGEPIHMGEKRVRTHLYPERVYGESVEVMDGEVYMQNGTKLEWVDMPLYFRHNRTLNINIYDNSTHTHVSRRVYITQDIETSFLLLMTQTNEFDFNRVNKIAESILFTLAYGKIYGAETEFEIGYDKSMFEEFGLIGLAGFFLPNITAILDFLWLDDENEAKGYIEEVFDGEDYDEDDINETHRGYNGTVMQGFYGDTGRWDSTQIITADEINIAYNLGIILEQMRVLQDYDESLLEDVADELDHVTTQDLKSWLGSGLNNRVNVQALTIMIFTEAGVIDDEVFTVGPHIEKYGDHGFMDLFSEKWYGTFFTLIVHTLGSFKEAIGISTLIESDFQETIGDFHANIGYVYELLVFAAMAMGGVLDSYHFNHDDELKNYVVDEIIDKLLGGLTDIPIIGIGFEELGYIIAETVILLADGIAWVLSSMGLEMTGPQILYLMFFGPFADENVIDDNGLIEDVYEILKAAIRDYIDNTTKGYIADEISNLNEQYYQHVDIQAKVDDINEMLDGMAPSATSNDDALQVGGSNDGVVVDNSYDDYISSEDEEEESITVINSIWMSPSDGVIDAGETIRVSARIENIGNETGTRTIRLRTNHPSGNQQESLTLGPESYGTVRFDIETEAGKRQFGDYYARIRTGDDSARVDFTVEEAWFVVQSVSAPCIHVGGTLEVEAVIENVGNIDGTQTLTMTTSPNIGSRTDSISLSHGNVKTVTFSSIHNINEPGHNSATVSSEDTSLEDGFIVSQFEEIRGRIREVLNILSDTNFNQDLVWFTWDVYYTTEAFDEYWDALQDVRNWSGVLWDGTYCGVDEESIVVGIIDDLEKITSNRYKYEIYSEIKEELNGINWDDENYWKKLIDLDPNGEIDEEIERLHKTFKFLDGECGLYDLICIQTDEYGMEKLQGIIQDYLNQSVEEWNEDIDEPGFWGTLWEILMGAASDDPDSSSSGLFALFERTNSNIVDFTTIREDDEDESRFAKLLRTAGEIDDIHDLNFDSSAVAYNIDNSDIHGEDVWELDFRLSDKLHESWQNTTDAKDEMREWTNKVKNGDEGRAFDLDSNYWVERSGRASFYSLATEVIGSMEDKVPSYINNITSMEPTFEYPAEEVLNNSGNNNEDYEKMLDENLTSTPVVSAPKAPFKIRISEEIHHVNTSVNMDYLKLGGIYDSGQQGNVNSEFIAENVTGIRVFETLGDDIKPGEVMTSYLNPFSTECHDFYMTSLSYMINTSRMENNGRHLIEVSARSDTLGGLERYATVTYSNESSMGDPSMSVQLYTPLPVVDTGYAPQSPLQVKIENVSLSRNVYPSDFDSLEDEVYLTFEDETKQIGNDFGYEYDTDPHNATYHVSVVAMIDSEDTSALAQSVLNFFSGIFGSDEHSNYKTMVEGKVVDRGTYDCEDEYENNYSNKDDYLLDTNNNTGYIDIDITEHMKGNWSKLYDGDEFDDDDDRTPLFITKVHKPVSYSYLVSASTIATLADDENLTDQFQFSPAQTNHEQGYIKDPPENNQDHFNPMISVFDVSDGYNFTMISNIPRDSWIVERNGIPFLVDFEDHPYLRRTLSASVQMDKMLSSFEKGLISIVSAIIPSTIVDEVTTALLPESEYRTVRAYRYIPVIKTIENNTNEPIRYPDRLIPLWRLAPIAGDHHSGEMWNKTADNIRERGSIARIALDPKVFAAAGGAIAAARVDINGLDRLSETEFLSRGFGPIEELVGFEEGYDFMQGAYLEYFIGESFPNRSIERSLTLSKAIWYAIGAYRQARRLLAIGAELVEIAAAVVTLGASAKVTAAVRKLRAVVSTANQFIESAEKLYSEMKSNGEVDFQGREREFREALEELTATEQATQEIQSKEILTAAVQRPNFNYTLSAHFYRRFGIGDGDTILESIEDNLEDNHNETLLAILNFDIEEENIEDKDLIDWLTENLPDEVEIYDMHNYSISNPQDIEDLTYLVGENVDLNLVQGLVSHGYNLSTLKDVVDQGDSIPSITDLYHSTKAFDNCTGISSYLNEISDGDWDSFRRLVFANHTQAEGKQVELYPFGKNEIPLLIDDTYTSYIHTTDTPSIDDSVFNEVFARGTIVINTTQNVGQGDLEGIISQLETYDPYFENVCEVKIIGRNGEMKARILTGAGYIRYIF